MYAKDLSESKHQFLIGKWGNKGLKNLNDSKVFIERSNTMDDVYENIYDYNPAREKKNFNCFWWHNCRHYE